MVKSINQNIGIKVFTVVDVDEVVHHCLNLRIVVQKVDQNEVIHDHNGKDYIQDVVNLDIVFWDCKNHLVTK